MSQLYMFSYELDEQEIIIKCFYFITHWYFLRYDFLQILIILMMLLTGIKVAHYL